MLWFIFNVTLKNHLKLVFGHLCKKWQQSETSVFVLQLTDTFSNICLLFWQPLHMKLKMIFHFLYPFTIPSQNLHRQCFACRQQTKCILHMIPLACRGRIVRHKYNPKTVGASMNVIWSIQVQDCKLVCRIFIGLLICLIVKLSKLFPCLIVKYF